VVSSLSRVLCVALLSLLATGPARADDSADEAELAFTLGAEAYQRGDYRTALQHFLVSNRLVANRNVLFNIARSYEELAQYPEAYRYYTQALDGESDPAARAKIEAALQKLGARIAVLRIETKPPGATLYLERRDLGARGTSPRRFGVAPGRYKVIAELPGYEPRELVLPEAKIGEELPVVLELEQILGEAEITRPAGAVVRVGDASAAPSCSVPCVLSLAPGRHRLFLSQAGFRPQEVPVDVVRDQRAKLAPELEALTGSLVVSTDEPGAMVRVDGRTRGFTPTIITLTVGEHDVIVSLSGFRDVAAKVSVVEGRETKLPITLIQAEEVVAASRVSETVEQAPSSVSIVSRRELQAFAYPTIAEALRGQPGVYLWDDRSYQTLGIRGLGFLGSYGNRVLVLYDGHPANDNWLGSSYVGYDAMTDLADAERIELVRGPGSVLYGTNAFSGVINVVERERDPGVSGGVSTNLAGVARGRLRGDVKLGRDGRVWSSVATARGQGRDFYFSEYDAPETNDGVVRGQDGFVTGSFRGGARYGVFKAQWHLHSHRKELPTGEYETDITDPRARQTDTRAFVELSAAPVLSESFSLVTRAHVNAYRFRGLYPRLPEDGGLEVDTYRGQWVGLEQRVSFTPADGLRFTLGGEGQIHYEVAQTARDESGVFLDDDNPYQIGAIYALADVDVTPSARVSAGARYDAYSSIGGSLNPRLAFVFAPYAAGTSKILGGRAFRAPSVYELYYNDGGITQEASPDLEPESVYSAELEHTHRFSSTIVGVVSTYGNYVSDVIVSQGAGDEDEPLYYENSRTPLVTLGGELGVRRDFRRGIMFGASYGISHARYLAGPSVSDLFELRRDPTRREVANAPVHLASVRGTVPILSRALLAATRISIEGPRFDRNEYRDDEPQGRSNPAVIWDLVLSGEEPRFGLTYSFGVYNAFDWRYSLPASVEFTQRRLLQDGRSFLASAEIAF
jgi:outer membrane receptor protein involved in Fe transport